MKINTDGLHSRVVTLLTQIANSSTLGHVKGGSNVNIAADGTMSVDTANVNRKGVVQLNDTLTSTAVDMAATANIVKTLNDKFETHKNNADIHFTAVERSKLQGVAANANNYTHPATHAASMITGLSTVATTGKYSDLLGLPTLGNAIGNIPLVGLDGKLDSSIMPPIAITDVHPVNSEAEMLALTAQNGDIAIRSDINANFVLKQAPASTLANWFKLKVPIESVTSVAGKTGVVVLAKGDVGLTNVDNVQQATKVEFNAHSTNTVLHITAAERSTWNAKASTAIVTATVNGLMSATDKVKLDTVATNANNYSLPTATSTILGGVRNGSNINNASGVLSVADASTTVKGVVQLVDNATSTSTILAPTANALKVVSDLFNTHRNDSVVHITAAERSTWNAKASTAVVTATVNGLMIAADKVKLDGVAANANNYVLPTATSTTLGGVRTGGNLTNTSGLIAVPDATTTLKGAVQLNDATDSTSMTQAATANAVKKTFDLANSANKLAGMQSVDGLNMNNIKTAGKYFGYTMTNSAATSISVFEVLVYSPDWIVQIQHTIPAGSVGKSYKRTWNNASSWSPWVMFAEGVQVTTTVDGLMSAADKVKLNGIAANANNYVLPTATTAVLGGVKNGANINNAAGVLSVNDGSTTAKGVVQLIDSITSPSITIAPTANSVRVVNEALNDYKTLIRKFISEGYNSNRSTEMRVSTKVYRCNPTYSDASKAKTGLFTLTIPASITGILEMDFTGYYSHGNATGGLKVIYHVGYNKDNRTFYANSSNVVSASSGFMGCFYVSPTLEIDTDGNLILKIYRRPSTFNSLAVNVKLSDGNGVDLDSFTSSFNYTDMPDSTFPYTSDYLSAGNGRSGLMKSEHRERVDNLLLKPERNNAGTIKYVKIASMTTNIGTSQSSLSILYTGHGGIGTPFIGTGVANFSTRGGGLTSRIVSLTEGTVSSTDKTVPFGYVINEGVTDIYFEDGNSYNYHPSFTILANEGCFVDYNLTATSTVPTGYVRCPDSSYVNVAKEATTVKLGLMSAADKVKLNGIAANANNYVLPTATTAVLGGVKNGANINNTAGVLSVNDGTTAVKGVVQLTDGVASASTTTAATPNAVKTVNDAFNTHNADAVKHITAAERTAWNAKASTASVTTTVNGLMLAVDKAKLDGIAANANNYVLPTATTAILGGVKNGANINNVAGVLSVNDGTTAAKGVVQLTDGVASTSITTAATPKSVKTVNDAFNTHNADAVKHITAAERTAWNAKAPTANPVFTGAITLGGMKLQWNAETGSIDFVNV